MKSMNHLNKVLLVCLIVLFFISSESLAGWFGWGSKAGKPFLISRACDNRVVNAVATRVGQHPVVASCAAGVGAGCLIGTVGKGLYDRFPTISSKAKACGSYLSSEAKKAYDSCASVVRNHKLSSGLIAGTTGAWLLLALDFWKKPMRGNPISAIMAKRFCSLLNNHKGFALCCGVAPLTWYLLSLSGKQQGNASKRQM